MNETARSDGGAMPNDGGGGGVMSGASVRRDACKHASKFGRLGAWAKNRLKKKRGEQVQYTVRLAKNSSKHWRRRRERKRSSNRNRIRRDISNFDRWYCVFMCYTIASQAKPRRYFTVSYYLHWHRYCRKRGRGVQGQSLVGGATELPAIGRSVGKVGMPQSTHSRHASDGVANEWLPSSVVSPRPSGSDCPIPRERSSTHKSRIIYTYRTIQ